MTESKNPRRLPLLVLLAGVAAVIVAAVLLQRGDEAPAPAEQNTLHRGIGSDPDSFDQHKTNALQSFAVLRDLGEGLVAYDRHGLLIPGVAESQVMSEDGLRYTFRLREDARWSNGDAVTADDFVYTYRRMADPATAALYVDFAAAIANANKIIAGELEPESLGVTAIDPLTLEIELEQPTPYFLAQLTHPSMHPIHEASVNLHGDAFARPGNLVTNGPYRLTGLRIGAIVELERNEHYWDNANTAIDRVHYHVLPEPMSEYNRFRAGELHITDSVPTDIFEQVQVDFADELKVATSFTVYYYGYNVTRPPFKDNPELRQALSMAIDREVLVEKITGRGEQPAYSWVPPGIDGYESAQLPFADSSREERIEQARRLYRAAGYDEDNPLEVELRYNTSDTHQRIALAIQAMWREALGFDATLINEEFRVLLANMQAREITQVFRSSWNGAYLDAQPFLTVFESGSPSNLAGWESDEYDNLMQRAAAQTDPDMRRRYLEEAERLLLIEQPLIPLYFYVSKHLVSTEVAGWADNILDYHYSRFMSLPGAAGGD